MNHVIIHKRIDNDNNLRVQLRVAFKFFHSLKSLTMPKMILLPENPHSNAIGHEFSQKGNDG